MGDWFETVVDHDVSEQDALLLADRVTRHFIGKRVVRAELSDCTLGSPGHAPDTGVLSYLREVDEHLLSLRINGFVAEGGRSVHVAPSLEQVTCPRCRVASRALEPLG